MGTIRRYTEMFYINQNVEHFSIKPYILLPSRVVLSEAVDWCICFTRKIQHPKNVHNFLMTVQPLSWACGHGTKMLLILKIYFWPDYATIFSDMTVERNIPRICTRSICGWNLFQPMGLTPTLLNQATHIAWCHQGNIHQGTYMWNLLLLLYVRAFVIFPV